MTTGTSYAETNDKYLLNGGRGHGNLNKIARLKSDKTRESFLLCPI